MSQIIKAFTGVFVVLFMMTTATGILGAFLQTMHAQNFHAAMIHELENSNYATNVLEECFSVAKDNAYDLEIIFYLEDGGIFICDEFEDLLQRPKAVSMARITLEYPVQIAFFEIDLKQQVYGYGR